MSTESVPTAVVGPVSRGLVITQPCTTCLASYGHSQCCSRKGDPRFRWKLALSWSYYSTASRGVGEEENSLRDLP